MEDQTEYEVRERMQESNRLLLWLGLGLGVIVVIVVAVVTVEKMTNSQEVDLPALKQQIRDEVRDQTGARVSVDCPSSVEWNTGGTFHCIVEDKTGTRLTATVSMENDDGDVTWRLE